MPWHRLLLIVSAFCMAACSSRPEATPPGASAPAPTATTATFTASAVAVASPTPAPQPTPSPPHLDTSTPPHIQTDADLGPTRPGRIENFDLVGRQDLERRGWNAGLALAWPCAYVGNRRLPEIAILDVGDPGHPAHAGDLPLAPDLRAVELRAVPALGLLVAMTFSPDLSLITYDIHDCRQPRPLGSLGLGAVPHEFYLWRDPRAPSRVLLYAAMWHEQPDLQVVDLSDPAQPRPVGRWSAAEEGAGGSLHSLSISRDGQRAYLALTDGGLLLADSSDFAAARPEPHLRLLRDAAGFAPAAGLGVHSAVPLADPRYVLITEEEYACPFAGVAIADAEQAARPQIVGRFELPENHADCAHLPPEAVFTAHNPLVVGDLAFITWYAGGLQALDLSRPQEPVRVGLYVPDGSGAAERSYIGAYPVQLWSYPILRAGLLYVSDIQSGLHILRYTGPGAAAANTVPLAEGNASTIVP